MIRLDKYLADCGVGTRTEIKKLIAAGFVSVEGIKKPSPKDKIEESSAAVYLNGKLLKYRKYIYLMLNKPTGYVSAVRDNHYKTVIDLVPDEYRHFEVFPMGRLDIDTVGLLVLTNDGDMAHRLLSPTRHIPKTYIATVDGEITKEDIELFQKGMDLGDFTSKPASLKPISVSENESVAEVVIFEGKFHQIKRMFEKTGKTVTFLKRVKMNELVLDKTLAEGEIRELTEEEVLLLSEKNTKDDLL